MGAELTQQPLCQYIPGLPVCVSGAHTHTHTLPPCCSPEETHFKGVNALGLPVSGLL